ncbi:adenosylcobinamide-GDP ribazoletransferase [Sagittula sp. P11]|uniref:adenosylcobinamide-GDP ribazoletransferase n=1 Tax=Sagittula sp. P11 TaxID=2009329 RepID=UPI000C2CE91D|nr:adenosylcobinamide-GDP ribazoletransferase [Sagittula sp. P11]AUC54471.1 adenosylcobinamide-GDP ribazoletransferase [Sagittula sp. P11]
MRTAHRLHEIRLAVMFLTRLPVGILPEPVPTLAEARWAFPLAGLPVGLAGGLVFALAGWIGLAPLLAAVLALAAMVMITGALHFDGLADVADGFGGGRDATHALEIMRDSRIGSYGAVALVLTVGAWAAALSGLSPARGLMALLALSVLSRLAMLVLLVELPSVRAKGLGQSASASGGRPYLPGALLALVLILPLGIGGLAALVAVAVTAALVAWRAQRRIGGQTGDVLGAAQLLCETAGLAALTLG